MTDDAPDTAALYRHVARAPKGSLVSLYEPEEWDAICDGIVEEARGPGPWWIVPALCLTLPVWAFLVGFLRNLL